MTTIPPNGSPTVTEIARRLQRVEDKLDERIASVDMLRAAERLFEAKLVGQQVAIQDMEKRTTKIESSLSKVNFALLGAFLTLLILIIVTILSQSGRGAG